MKSYRRPSGVKHTPKKSLGQNFLINTRACQKIVEACDFHADDFVLEIGPGKGALTELILDRVERLTVVEKDCDLVQRLEQRFLNRNIEIIQGDILRHTIPMAKRKVKVVGNIPYNISTPIVEHHIRQRENIDRFFMTVQLEFGRRMAAEPGSKEYGSLSCFAQFYADVNVMFQIKNTSFYPIPKVHSCFVEMRFLDQPRYHVSDENGLFTFIQQTFTKRRKTILNALHTSLDKEVIKSILDSHDIDSKKRPENISLREFVKLYEDVAAAEQS